MVDARAASKWPVPTRQEIEEDFLVSDDAMPGCVHSLNNSIRKMNQTNTSFA